MKQPANRFTNSRMHVSMDCSTNRAVHYGWRTVLQGLIAALAFSTCSSTQAEEDTVCARVKIEIQQEVTLERQGFDAEMKIANTLDSTAITDVGITVSVADEDGQPVAISEDPNDTSAKLFIRVSGKENIAAVDGTGTVNPATTAVVNWLLIPAPGAAGNSPAGKKYLVGARLRYKLEGEEQILDVAPDVITVKPLPLLTLDYFLTQDVNADDPLTPEIEPIEPFILGARVRNSGLAAAKALKIDSAQPKIVENNQGLLINFKLNDSYVNDAPVQNTLLVDFGDVAAGTSEMARWNMETTLAGKFTEFSAKFSHADELGGMLTSLLQAVNAHFLLRDVRVDLPGRDYVRDFLATDTDAIRVYESDGTDTVVINRSAEAVLTATNGTSGTASYQLVIPPTTGFAYVKLPDPFLGEKALGQLVRSDAKSMLAENVWLSKTKNKDTEQWEYWLNLFDANTPGIYTLEFQAPPAVARAPQIQWIPDRVVTEENLVSFLVEASSPDGKPVTVSAAPLPAGATLIPQTPDPQSPLVARAIFEWTPAKNSAGEYLVVYTATDGELSATRSAKITVEANVPPPGPITPTIESPASGAQVTTLTPALKVMTSPNPLDPTVKVQFELYSDEAMTLLADSALIDEAPAGAGGGAGLVAQPTSWQVPNQLTDNTHYWWRARSFDGVEIYSTWVNGRFFVNLYNDAPDSFNLTSPAPNFEVAVAQPTLSWTNSADKDGDLVTYSLALFTDVMLTEQVTTVSDLAPGEGGTTSWTVDVPLSNHITYFWQVIAKDALNAQTVSAVRPFVVNTGNSAPTSPVIVSPAAGSQSITPDVSLVVQNSTDTEGDVISYVFELDTVNTFDSNDKRISGAVSQGDGGTTSWDANGLVENTRYWWRVKAQDGRAESSWVVGDFLVNAANDPPPVPTVRNPGDGAWSSILQPVLEVNPVQDPEGDPVSYHFEAYYDAGLTQKFGERLTADPALLMPVPLADKTTYWWRVRAVDDHGLASAWGPAVVLYVSTAPYQLPTIQVTSPVGPVEPELVATNPPRKRLTIRWEGTDPNIEPTIALFYDGDTSGFDGNLIVDGLRQPAGTVSGSYEKDVTAVAPGTYFIYALIYDAKGLGKAYAPGALVIPNPASTAAVVINPPDVQSTSENGDTAVFNVRLNQAPTADVVIPVSSDNARKGIASPSSLTFTPTNWSVEQPVTVTGQNDCTQNPVGEYHVVLGKAVSLDPDHMGISGPIKTLNNVDTTTVTDTTNNANIHICKPSLMSQTQIDSATWEYVISAELTNSGSNVSGVTARLRALPSEIQVIDDTLAFGAVNSGETAKTNDTITLRGAYATPAWVLQYAAGFKWDVVVQ